ncbi:O-antigen ligase family protein, partial [Escherichia coli]|nr:O-antigen ligase family protein [Escherichia coli]
KTLVLVLGAVAALALYAFAGISGRESGGAAEDGIDASAMGRLYAWEAAFKMALHHPFTGVGLDNFYFNYYFYSTRWVRYSCKDGRILEAVMMNIGSGKPSVA